MIRWETSRASGADDLRAQDVRAGGREDVVDLLAVHLRRVEAGEGPDDFLVRMLQAEGVDKRAAGRHRRDREVPLARVEVAGDEDRLGRERALVDPFAQELRAPLARGL